MNNFLVHTDETRKEMLDFIGVDTIDDLFKAIPQQVKTTQELKLDNPINEIEALRKLKKIAAKNEINYANFLGGGTYNRFIPACVGEITRRFEFITAYTPYQPEISQGTLQAIYEYQSMICNLTGMDVANASVYDGATACAEAIFMASRITGKDKILVAETINKTTLEVINTYCQANEIKIDFIPSENYLLELNGLEESLKNEYACVLIQSPNYNGSVEDLASISDLLACTKTLFVVYTDISSLAVLNPPSDHNADIVVGDIQSLGIPMSFGGPYCGFIACKDAYKRQLAGRIVGMTLDKNGERAFTLTLQTREQHIRREKATSNICSNQALIALAATVYLTVMGHKGLKQVISQSIKNAHELATGLNLIDKIKIVNKNYLYEFVIFLNEITAEEFLSKMKSKGILAGIQIDDDKILVCATEMNTNDEIQQYIESAQEILKV